MQKNIAIIGAGQMGSGIAVAALKCGQHVTLIDKSESALTTAREKIQQWFDKRVQKGDITAEQAKGILGALKTSDNMASGSAADIWVEAVTENKGLKQSLLQKMVEFAKPEAVIGSNTSSISLTELAASTSCPERVVGIHFMNPVPVMALVEIIKAEQTSQETFNQAVQWVKELQKTPVISADQPGFIVNRILMPMINEAIFTLQEGVATVEDIDAAMTLGAAHPMGPLKLADLIGLDTCHSILSILHKDLGEDKYRPCPLLTRYVHAGWLGRKTSKGFYTYDNSIA